MKTQGTVSINDLPALKELYTKAVEDGTEIFKFNGMDIYTSFAKYLIQHLENQNKKLSN